jgi:MOSC domain-containing protein YiiM
MRDVVLEVTAPRIPCVTLARRMDDPAFPKLFRAAERPGVYCRVLCDGAIQVGDTVHYEPVVDEPVTVRTLFRDFFVPLPISPSCGGSWQRPLLSGRG